MINKGVIMAGGTGSRLYPLTKVINKHLLPIYDKPMIYYPLSTLLLAGVREILIITNPSDKKFFQKLLGNGRFLGVKISYKSQHKPKGIADVFNLCKNFVKKEKFFLILGDNVFFGSYLSKYLKDAMEAKTKCVIFSYNVKNPQDYGVISYKKNSTKILKIFEKPKKFISNDVVTGLYIYDYSVFEVFKTINFSKRGEYEITDINNFYAKSNSIENINLGRGITWIDAGTFENLYSISSIIYNIQLRQGRLISSPEEIAHKFGYIKKKLNDKEFSYKNEYYNLLKKIKNA